MSKARVRLYGPTQPYFRQELGAASMTTMTVRLLAVALLFSMPQAALAQSPPGQAAPAAATTRSDQLLKPEQLDALVTPIALYPDTLLAEVFMASTWLAPTRCVGVRVDVSSGGL